MQSFDIIIIGGGMIGLSLACGLRNCGMNIAIIENSLNKDEFDQKNEPESKVSAINLASQKLLDYLSVWQIIIQKKIGIFHQIKVWQKDSFGYIKFNANDYYLPHLGHIIKNSTIVRILWQQVKLSTDITLFTDNNVKTIMWGDNEVFITFDNEQMLTTKLVIGADGAKSWLRKQADIPIKFWNYEHTSLIATIKTEIPHMDTALQAFNNYSILAFLPLHDQYICSIVWSLPTIQAHRLVNLKVSAFEKELSVALDMRLGFCQLISERQIFPLISQYACNFAKQRIVLIGDSAHTIHPLAGQGVNLGFMDVAELIGHLRDLNIKGKDIGQYLYLQSYERKRRYSTMLTLYSIQMLKKIFNGNNVIKKITCDIGLLLTNAVPGIKLKLINYASGLHDIPEWLAKNDKLI
ncbi:2-octaprenylphenol hydroxylase [Candidatus Arsenophonus lipoptenae]|uniref:2-octaprenylphenol hydroxylase n=1 Tax=Candidatus Arsenophonus lipoptenae TaxID=634113 RepID=A0A0X8CXC9_9GAMM|nr:FAD-dependent monooxygenase [Candidatus Arsenophonus lipoptenae]AMA64692.1 2-octaprenylphenol hydroxylase [Candidatus Arsenophonus lipoptenae]